MKPGNILLTISGILMFAASLTAAAVSVLVFMSRLSAVNSSFSLSLLSCALAFVWAFINLYSGLGCILGRKRKKQLKKYFFLGIFSVLLFIFQSILAATNGIAAGHLLILFICGFAIPCFNLSVCRTKI